MHLNKSMAIIFLISFFCHFNSLNTASATGLDTMRASDLANILGVNVHMAYSNTSYLHYNNIIRNLEWLGIEHVRDVIPPQHTPAGRRGAKVINILAGHGFKLTLAVNHRPFDEQLTILEKIETTNPGSITAIEGFNEINNWPITVDGKTGKEGAALGQMKLYSTLKKSELLGDIPVLNMTGHRSLKDDPYPYGEVLDGFAEADNFHIYAQNGMQPSKWITSGKQTGQLKGKPAKKYITEFGYATMPQSGWLIIGVDEFTQAKGILNGIFAAAASGFSRLFIYELIDQKLDIPPTKRRWHWGLFRSDGTPKPAAFVIRRLNRLLENQSNFVPQSLVFSIQSPIAHAGIKTHLVALSGNSYLLAIWHEPDFWDRKTGTPISAEAVSVTVKFDKNFNEIKTLDIIKDETVSHPSGNLVSFTINDYVSLLLLKESTPALEK